MYHLRIRKLAQNDSNEIFEYYDNINSLIALKFLDSLHNELEVISENPELFQLKYKNTQVRYLRKFPYGGHYRVVNEEIIEILSVLHTSRNPKFWKKRNK